MSAALVKRKVMSPESEAVLSVGAALLLAAVLGYWSAYSPVLVYVAFVPIALLGLMNKSVLRFAFVTFGGLVVLQSSQGIDARKLAYFAGCAVVFGIAYTRSPQLQSFAAKRILRPFFVISAAWVLVVAVSFPVAMVHGSAPMDWIRDVIPYLLVAAMPFLAVDVLVDLQGKPASRLSNRLFLVYGLLTAIGFSVNWISRRGYSDTHLEGLFFSTFIFPCALLSYVVSKSISGNAHKPLWALLASLIFFLFVLTGTRTSLVMLAAPAIILVGQGSGFIKVLPRVLMFALAAVTIGMFSLAALPQLIDVDTSQVFARFMSLEEVATDSAAGQSFDERSAQARLTLDAFLGSPVLGVGPGHIYEWSTPYNNSVKTAYVLDSPLSIPAKFGLGGILVYLLTLGALFSYQSALSRFGDICQVERDTIRGFLATVILLSLLGSPVDDKGFSFAIAFLLVIGMKKVLLVENKGSAYAAVGFSSDPVLQSSRVAS